MFSFQDILKINFERLINFGNTNNFFASGVSIDSRKIKQGELFVAIKGKSTDGHKYILKAIRNGAHSIAVEKHFYEKKKFHQLLKNKLLNNVPIIVVKDTVFALGELANTQRKKFDIPFIAIAGSNGKTTVKDMITAVLKQKYNVLSTEGNLNNQIGVPLTLFRLNKNHDIAVVEIGTNHFGEIEYLCKVLEPTHGLITNIGNEHLEFLKDIQGVVKEESALFKYLAKRNSGAIAFVNIDDKNLLRNSQRNKNKKTFGTNGNLADVFSRNEKIDINGNYKFDVINKNEKKKFQISLSVPGKHNVLNAVGAVAAGLTFQIPMEKIKKSLESFKASTNRMEIIKIKGITILNDSYNSNLDSTIAALEILESIKNKGKKIIVFGDMLELGKYSKEHHKKIGKVVTELCAKIENPVYLYTFGRNAKYIFDSAKVDKKFHYSDKKLLVINLIRNISKNDNILVKGSRGMKMEEVVNILKENIR